MKIGILMPCYNVGQYLSDAIKSCENQDFENYNIYASDDNSTDNTYELLKSYQKVSIRLRIFKNEQKLGWAGNYNFLANKALDEGCTHLFVMGADDMIQPDTLSRMFTALKEDRVDFVVTYGQMFGVREELMTSKEHAILKDFREENVIMNFALISAFMWQTLQGYNTDFFYADWEFWIRALKGNFKYSVIKDTLYKYRLHGQNSHAGIDHKYEKNLIIQKHFNS